MFKARNKGVEAEITKSKNSVVVSYRFHGKYDKVFGIFEGGQRTIKVESINGKSKNQRVGQKKIVTNGFRRAVRKWQKLNTFRIEEALRARNLAKI